ncbi:beta strand repeat-containing protein [Modicisalibacter tunisiensis]|uniref:Calcium-binding protein n=1 Tax=Modicisalibacter tunisiensis TaxID=390637 RepID=A0ABS7WU47_9GAMM|nr:calcium-binding protein [Modicisalibacter tunisiensis]MBZ9566127.1 calcium-binding protein [Modicisalibacter tunisiensis]
MELTATEKLVHQMYIAYYQRPADPEGLQYWVNQLEQNGNWSSVSAAFGAAEENDALYGGMSRADVIKAVYDSAFNRAAVDSEVSYWDDSGFSLTDLAFAIINGAQNDDLATVNAKVDFSAELVSQVGSNDAYLKLQNVNDLLDTVDADTDVTAESVSQAIDSHTEGQTFTLTADNAGDIVTLTGNNDTVTAEAGSLAGTVISDQGGNDTLTATLNSNLDATTRVQGVEDITLNWDSYSAPSLDVDGVSGAEITLNATKSGFVGNATVQNLGDNSLTAGEGITGNLTTSGVADSTVNTGSAKTVTVDGTAQDNDSVVVNAGDSTTDITVGNTTGVEDVTVTAGAATTDVTVNQYDTATIDAGTASNIDVTADDSSDTATVTVGADATVTASAANGSLTLNVADGKTVTVNNIGEDLTIAGDGDVTLKSSGLNGETVSNAKESGSLTVESSVAGTLNLEDVEADEIKLSTAGSTTATLASGANVAVSADLATGVFQTGTNDSKADSVNISFSEDQKTTTTFTNFETVNIEASAEAGTGTDLTIASLAASGATVNVTGDNDVELSTIATKSLDASALTGDLTIGGSTSADATIAGSEGKNDVTMDASNAGDKATFVGQDSDDIAKFGTLAETAEVTAVTGGGNDTVNADISGMGTGGSTDEGFLVVEAGAGDDVVNLANGSGALASPDSDATVVLQMGEGSDTLQISGNAGYDLSGTNLTISSVEKVDLGQALTLSASQFNSLGDFELVGSAQLTADGSASTDALTIDGSNVTLNFGSTATFAAKGGAAGDTITGTVAGDTITGNGGNDTLTGGKGADTFDFAGNGTDKDTITDFVTGTDKMSFDGIVGTDITATSGTALNAGSVTTAAALTDGSVYVTDDASASLLSTGGSESVSDFTDMSDVAAFLAEGFSATAAGDAAVFVLNDGNGQAYTYLFQEQSSSASNVDAGDLSLVGVVTESNDAAIVAGDIA